ncbi:MAG: hypothetical protein AAF558_04410 [Verrucomicrobiota bacterium]
MAIYAATYGVLALIARAKFWCSSWIDGHPYMLEGASYIRLIRARTVIEDNVLFQRFHGFENFPEGITTHLTALPDWCIAGFAKLLSLWIESNSIEWAGWLIPPLLGALSVICLFYLVSMLSIGFGKHLFLTTYSLSPALVWSSALGHPSKWMLVVPLIAFAFVSEALRWRQPNASWKLHLLSGCSWGLLLWLSLWQSMLLLIALLMFNLAFRNREHWIMPLVAVGLGSFFWMLERFPTHGGMLVSSPEAARWMESLTSVQPPSWLWWISVGFGFPLMITYFLMHRPKDIRVDTGVWIGLTASCLLLANWQLRWLPHFILLSSLLCALAWPSLSSHWRRAVLVGQILPIIVLNLLHLPLPFSPIPAQEIRQLASKIDRPGGIVASWELCPHLSFFSRQPTVAGISPQALPGILDSAKIFNADTLESIQPLLKGRSVQWIVIGDTGRLKNRVNSLLGTEESNQPKWIDALSDDLATTDIVTLKGVSHDFRLFSVAEPE